MSDDALSDAAGLQLFYPKNETSLRWSYFGEILYFTVSKSTQVYVCCVASLSMGETQCGLCNSIDEYDVCTSTITHAFISARRRKSLHDFREFGCIVNCKL